MPPATANHAKNARIFRSVLHGADTDKSDLDLLIDPLPRLTLFRIAQMQIELERMLGVKVDIRTPGDLPEKVRTHRYERMRTCMNAHPEQAAINNLQALLERQFGIRLGILFGSVAHGTARTDSDIDIAVLLDHPLSAEEKIGLIEQIATVSGRPVDLIDLATAGEPLLGEILKGKRLVGSNENYARPLTKHLIDAADFLPLQQRILKERRDAWIK